MKITRSLQEFNAFAREFALSLRPGKNATVINLSGNLGSGKTTFTQEVARSFGVVETVTSPTFVIEKIYTLPDQTVFKHLIHIDAYRLEGERELEVLGFKELCADPHNLILVEWGERVAGLLPTDTQKISFKFVDENTREISM